MYVYVQNIAIFFECNSFHDSTLSTDLQRFNSRTKFFQSTVFLSISCIVQMPVKPTKGGNDGKPTCDSRDPVQNEIE